MPGEHSGGQARTSRTQEGDLIRLRSDGVWVYSADVWSGDRGTSSWARVNRAGDVVSSMDLTGSVARQYNTSQDRAYYAWSQRHNGPAPTDSGSGGNSPAAHRGSGGGGDLMGLIHQAGFRGTAAQTMYAIVLAESGGNAHAHNGNSGTGDNSYGLAQINMIGSMGPARLRQYGLSSNDDLFDPLTNLRVAYRLSNGGQNFSPWTTYTRGTYQQFMGQSGATVSNGGSGNTANAGLGGSGTLHLSGSDYRDALGPLAGLLQAVPSLQSILRDAVTGGWSTTKFTQAIERSDWYRHHGENFRTFISLRYSDPGTYHDNLASAERSISQTASRVGATLTSGQLQALATRSIVEGWDSETMLRAVGHRIDAQGDQTTGAFGDYYLQLKQLYANYGLTISDKTLRDRARNAAMTNGDVMKGYQTSALSAAKGLYPSLSSQLDAGATVNDIADSYRQTMGKMLEIDPAGIGLDDPTLKRALQGSVVTNDAGKSSAVSTPLYQFEQRLRADPRWQYTNNAKDDMSSVLLKVGQDWGFMGS